LSGTDCATGSASTMEWDAAAAYCDGLTWGGQSDWYLPDVRQLPGIADAGRTSPAINPTAFPATPSLEFWSSSSYSGSSSYAWAVYFSRGNVIHSNKSYSYRVRCIRRGPWTSGRFDRLVLSGDRVVRDTSTGRMWQGCVAGLGGAACSEGSPSLRTWRDALAYCDTLSWGGYDDWRLPDRNELRSIVDYGRMGPAIDPAAFPGTPGSHTWSSSSDSGSYSFAWRVRFDDGNVFNYGKSSNTYNVRCIRRGP
jgi:hypothetical protein